VNFLVEYKIEIDRTLCLACGTCYTFDPIHFKPDQTGKSTIIGGLTDDNSSFGTFGDNKMEEAQEALDSCPESAITLTKQ
jgi:ferredoxin